jgi:hypothetical protein
MNFELIEEHLMIQQAARDFANTECLPGVIERDEKNDFSQGTGIEACRTWLLGMMVNTITGLRHGYHKLCNRYGRNFKG